MRRSIQTLAIACLSAAHVLGAAGVNGQVFTPSPLSWIGAAAEERLPAAVGGYCVVTLRNQRRWQVGDERVSGSFDGRQYYFASQRDRDIFAAAPETYAPVLRGDCVVTLASAGRRVVGRLDQGVVHGGRLFFFADGAARAQFQADPTQFESIDLAADGQCQVSRVNEARLVRGLAKSVAVRHGLRFQFASAHQRRLFLENPTLYDDQVDPVAAESHEAPPEKSLAAAPRLNATKGADQDARQKGDAESNLLGAVPAMGGYCPVTIRNQGAWVRGRYDHRVELDDWTFLTASSEQREALAADPAKYIPALGGDCVVSLVDSGRRVRGSVFHAFEYDDRLFLFADAEHKASFEADPDRYATADVAEGGLCVVTRQTEGRETPGLPAYAAWRRARLYRLAGPEQLKLFLADPDHYAAPEGP